MNKQIIKNGYDRTALKYLQDRRSFSSNKYLKEFLQLLPKKASILDLGCGAGIPIDDVLIKNNHLVTGIDISQRQIDLARKNCPKGLFTAGDITDLRWQEYHVDAVISLYTIFHLPKETHLQFLKKINSFLSIGGLIFITMGDCDFEGFHDFYGEKMWSSHYGSEKNLEMVKEAGFKVEFTEIDQRGRERHQIIMARKVVDCFPADTI